MVTPEEAREIIHEWMYATKPAIETGAKAVDALRDLVSQVENLQAKIPKDSPVSGDGFIWNGEKWIPVAPGMETYALLNILKDLDSLKANSERYRWEREHPAWETEAFLADLSPEQYDAAIDKARTKS